MRLTLSSLQWFIFILANAIVAPLSIGHAFGMDHAEIAGLLQRSFFLFGLASLLQGFFGHRLPLLAGPAGLWWGVFLTYAGFVSSSGDAVVVLRSLELGLLISGVLFIVLSALRLMDVIRKLFTPLVMGTTLMLLVVQLGGSFLKGILGIGYRSSHVDPTVAICALATLVFAVILARSGNKFLSSYSVLISLAFGWALFAVVGIAKPIGSHVQSWFSLPSVFVWGAPTFNLGVVLTSVFIAFLLMVNLITSVNVVADVVEEKGKLPYNRSGFIMGINQLLAGIFSTVGGVPLSAAAGFISTTKVKKRAPFLIGSAIILIVSFFPMLMTFLASIPMPVGYATIFLSIAGLAGIALSQYRKVVGEERPRFIVSFSLMLGFGLTFIPEEAWNGFPKVLGSLLSNGLVVGVLACMILEQFMRTGKRSEGTEQSS
ncbi:MAG TPA: purine/pyrimidine permease [Bacillales bacterium]|nr:purine/pyrimidine permease [Bacillales bacterium]